VLLPFTFDQAALDAVSGTSAPLAQPIPTGQPPAAAPVPAASLLSSLTGK
jgi:hypothetical protein